MSTASGSPGSPTGRSRGAGRIFRLTIGWILTVAGLVLSVPFIPGPGFLFFLSGVALLSTESRWVRQILRRLRERRLVRRAMREAERVGFKIDPGPGPDPEDEAGPDPPRA